MVHGKLSSYVHRSKEISMRGMIQDKLLNNRGGHTTDYARPRHSQEGTSE
jgi:hypothetical protein